jgi:hypothetical protein
MLYADKITNTHTARETAKLHMTKMPIMKISDFAIKKEKFCVGNRISTMDLLKYWLSETKTKNEK